MLVNPVVCCLLTVVGDWAQLLPIGPDGRQLEAELISARNGFCNGENEFAVSTPLVGGFLQGFLDAGYLLHLQGNHFLFCMELLKALLGIRIVAAPVQKTILTAALLRGNVGL